MPNNNPTGVNQHTKRASGAGSSSSRKSAPGSESRGRDDNRKTQSKSTGGASHKR
jgi:hypothetical protein